MVGSDEGVGDDENENYIQLLIEGADGSYKVHNNILLFEGSEEDGKEMDIEGITVEEDYVYVIGSHSSKRIKVDEDDKYETNKKNFRHGRIVDEKNRYWLYRLKINSDGKEVSRDRITLRKVFKEHPVLKTFTSIPGKENGINIEGIAAKDGWLYIGFRTPVFRDSYVPIMKLKFDDYKNKSRLLYVKLGGRGIRGMVSVSDGFLILAGPVGDDDTSYHLYHWDGNDFIPGRSRGSMGEGQVHLLGEINPPENGKAEGVAVIGDKDDSATFYKLIIAYDSVENKNNIMQNFYVTKP